MKASVNGVATRFKLDTGADVSVIPDTVFRKLKSQLSGTKRTLTDQIKGSFTAHIKVNENELEQEIFVDKEL